ncbi:MAG: Osmosensitive K+ channel histidine kinase KdpD, partial [uncultured Microvirga sp.]
AIFSAIIFNALIIVALIPLALRGVRYKAVGAGALLRRNLLFFFLPPLYTFTIADPTNVASLVLFTVVAVLVSNLASRVRVQAAIARNRAKTTESLYGFSRKLTSCTGLDDVLWATAFQMASLLSARVVLLLPDAGGHIEVRAGFPPEDTLDPADIAAAKVAFDSGKPAGRGADTLPGAKRLFLPMRTNRGTVGVVGLDSDKPGPLLTPEQRRLFDALSDQAALAVQQVQLIEDLDRAKLNAETDRLRQALLTSISHDLRTPLAAIMGSAGTLLDYEKELDAPTRTELLRSIQDESERLNRFIANLLDMTRLESGAVAPNRAPHDVSEIVASALHRAAKVLVDRRVEVSLAADLPMVDVDPVLLEQVLFNLLDNAAKYALPETTIRVQSWPDGSHRRICLQVLDEGDGIPPEDLQRIFDKFHRAQKGDRVRAGTGLGLAVCRGFIEAMGGSITAANRADRPGAVFTVTLPAANEASALERAA